MEQTTAVYNKWLYLFIGLAILVNLSGLFIPIIGPDGTLYATIAKTMVQRNDYVDLVAFGSDWLDKPHFPFWMTALFFKLLGFQTWAYKLPAILFLFMGACYTFLFATRLYGKQIALWSVLILLTAQHIILSNNDVRAEPYLTGLIIAAVYHLYRSYNPNSFWHLLAGCLFTACAIMTKGMFALIPIGGALVGHFIITRQWRLLFAWRWMVAVVLILIFILPELYCLNQQFDLHPEKLVFGLHHVSGIKFFFWDSQFGRFFNTGPIKGHGDPSFFVHTTLWAFLPWSLLLFAAVFQFIKKGVKNVQETEWYCISGAMLTFLLFSASKFQLPHYLNIVFPFFAIITARYLYNVKSGKSIKGIRAVQMVVNVLMLVIITLLEYYFISSKITYDSVAIKVLIIAMLIYLPRKSTSQVIPKVIFRTLIVSFIVNLWLNTTFYPMLMHYQSGSEAAMWINKNNPNKLPVVEISDEYMTAMQFYSDQIPVNINPDGTGNLPNGPFLLYATNSIVNQLNAKGWHTQTVKTFQRYWVSRLTLGFLNKATRAKELTPVEVVLVQPLLNPPR